MHCLSIVFAAGAPVLWKLIYRTEEKAKQAYELLSEPTPEGETRGIFEDDFGQKITIRFDNIIGMMLEDLEQSKLAHVEMTLHEARTRSKAGQMAQTDPQIRQANMLQGPAVLSPGMFNGRM